jgi:hypothetical protein
VHGGATVEAQGDQGGKKLSKDTQKRIIAVLSTALAAWTATRLAGSFLNEPEERGARDDVKEALLQGTFSILFTLAASWVIRNVLSKRWGA